MTATDVDLLYRYAREGSEESFTALVNRHLDLVYSAALRQVRLPALAQEVAQSVFIELSRSACRIKPDSILTAWLYAVTRRRAIDVVRRESRRQLREQIAWENNDMNSTTSDWNQIEPLLDEAMEALDETDRAAILLRYFENKSLREVGEMLGTSEDAAQKRVSRAIERLREFFTRKKVSMGAAELAAVISANAVEAAPAGLSATISAAAVLSGAAIHTANIIGVTKAISMTTIQKALIAATITATLGTGVYEAHRASSLADQVQALQQGQLENKDQKDQALDDAMTKLTALQSENNQLRTQLASLRRDSEDLARMKAENDTAAKDPTQRAMLAWLDRVNRLKQRLAQMPNLAIPEMRYLTDEDWLSAANGNLDTEKDYARALSSLRNAADNAISYKVFPALQKYMTANGGQFPTDLSQLQPYFESPIDADIMQRWEIVPASQVPNMHFGGNWVITQKSAVDPANDSRVAIGQSGYGVAGGGFDSPNSAMNALIPIVDPILQAYHAANNGNDPTDPAQLMPYATTADQQAALQKIIQLQKSAQK